MSWVGTVEVMWAVECSCGGNLSLGRSTHPAAKVFARLSDLPVSPAC